MKIRIRRVTVLACYLASMLPFCPAVSIAQSAVVSGEILTIDATANGGLGALFGVDRQTGQRTLLSDFNNSSQGVQGRFPDGVAWLPFTVLGPPPSALVIDSEGGTNFGGALIQVNPQSGARTVMSDFGNMQQGPLGVNPVAVLARSVLGVRPAIYVVDPFAGTNGSGALFSVDSTTGEGTRILVSDFGNISKGPLGAYPDSVTAKTDLLGQLLDPNTVYVADAAAGTNNFGAVFSVNTTTGVRTLISDFGNSTQGPVDPNPLSGPVGIVIAPQGCPLAGTIYVINANAGAKQQGVLVRIDPMTGNRTIVSDFGDGQMPSAAGLEPGALAWETANGRSLDTLIVQDGDAGTNGLGALIVVNPVTGKRILLSDFGNENKGPLGSAPAGAAIVP